MTSGERPSDGGGSESEDDTANHAPHGDRDQAEGSEDADFRLDELRRLRSELDDDVERFDHAGSMDFRRRVKAESIVGGDQFVLNMGGRSARRAPGWYRLTDTETTEMEQVYVRPPCAEQAEETLRAHHVLVLRGPRHSGRRFLATAVAVTLLQRGGQCRFLAPGTDPDALVAADVKPGCAYVLETGLRTTGERELTGFTLSRLSRVLTDRRAYLVLVVTDASPVSVDMVTWTVSVGERPDGRRLLRSHLLYRLPTDRRALADVLLDDPEVAEWLASGPIPAEIAHTARELARTADGTVTVSECMAQAAGRIRQDAAGLLQNQDLHRELALAVAFFGGFPYATVNRLANRLADVVYEASTQGRVRPRPFLDMTRKERLEAVRAVTFTAAVHTRYGSSPAEVVDFATRGLASALIDVVWQEYDAALLLRWLSDLVHDRDAAVRRRAAVVMGRLSLQSFAEIAEEVLQPWALSPDSRDRVAAAIALSVAVREPAVAAHALGLVESWSSAPSRYRRMTAALAWGLAVTPVQPVAGLQGLGELLDAKDEGVTWAVRFGLSAAFTSGLHALVLEAMGTWLDDAGDPARGQLLGAFVRICRLYGADGRPDAVHWPSVLWLFDRYGQQGPGGDERPGGTRIDEDVVDLWRGALAHRVTTRESLNVLEAWIRQADRHGESREALLDLVDELIVDDGDFRRLDHHLRRLAHEPSDPSYTAQLALQELDALR
ncbi:hypothetical protein [Streptomyces gilvus]|uniref:hypothetical protein n=1 Tax=Streptomyces gilvus TaxID=2920937 RepID=UPI001F10E2CB|nr:hypothetical protein [Streptomyces sp. CME 23]MCH5677354.1 hypothetical protein [Streptomyces sp. CME 23]